MHLVTRPENFDIFLIYPPPLKIGAHPLLVYKYLWNESREQNDKLTVDFIWRKRENKKECV